MYIALVLLCVAAVVVLWRAVTPSKPIDTSCDTVTALPQAKEVWCVQGDGEGKCVMFPAYHGMCFNPWYLYEASRNKGVKGPMRIESPQLWIDPPK